MATQTPLVIDSGRLRQIANGDTLAPASLPTMVGDAGSGGTKGTVPTPAAGDAVKVLKGSGVWDQLDLTDIQQELIVGSPTDNTTLRRMLDHSFSAGVTDGAVLTDNGDGTVGVGFSNVFLRATLSCSITRSGATATVTATAHNYLVGDIVYISGATQTEYNGYFAIQTVPTSDTFTVTVSGAPASPATGSPIVVAEHTALITCSVPALNPISLTDAATNYIYAAYNGGTPAWQTSTSLSTFNCLDKCIAYLIVRDGTTLYTIDARALGVDHDRKRRRVELETTRFAHVLGGSMLSETGTRNIAVSAGAFYFSTRKIDHNAFDTSGSSVFTYYYSNGSGGWTKVASQTQINNTQYDDGSGTLATLSNNKYGVHWVYLLLNGPTTLAVQYGTGNYTTIAEAQVAAVPTTPPNMTGVGILVGRIIIQKSAASFTEVSSAFTKTFVPGVSSTHNNLAGLQGGGSGEYYHMTSAQTTAVGNLSGTNTGDEDVMTGDSGSGGVTGLVPAPSAGDATKVLSGAATWIAQAGGFTAGTAVTVSGTSVDFTGLPSTVKQIAVVFDNVSTNGTSHLLVQIRDSGGVENSGYHSASAFASYAADYSTAGFHIAYNSAAGYISGCLLLSLVKASTNTWAAQGTFAFGNISLVNSAGAKSLSGTLDGLRITTVGGVNTFDAGVVNILYI